MHPWIQPLIVILLMPKYENKFVYFNWSYKDFIYSTGLQVILVWDSVSWHRFVLGM